MTTFIILGAIMVSIALGLVTWPLFRSRATEGRGAVVVIGMLAVALPVGAALLYRSLSNWSWDPAVLAQAASGEHSLAEMVTQLEARLSKKPDDVDGWLMLGRTQIVTKNYPRAVSAYAEAYKVSGGKNLEAVLGYGEALTLADQNALRGRAGELFEDALKLDPDSQKALWFGGVGAAVSGRLDVARSRWAKLVRTELPQEVKAMLAQRIAEVDRELGRPPDTEIAKLAAAAVAAPAAPAAQAAPAADGGGGSAAAAPGPGAVTVHVKLSAALAARLPPGAPLFVLARDPSQPGPPFAAKRFPSPSLPMDVVLTEQDAMMPARTLRTAHQLVIVARFSTSGAPTASSGDFYGEVPYDLAKGAAVDLVVDKQVP